MAQKLKNKTKKIKVWFFNKTKLVRKMGKPMAARIRRNIHLSGIVLFFLLIILSFFYPLSPAQQLKRNLLSDHYHFGYHLELAEIFLRNHQFKQANQTLLLAQNIKNRKPEAVGQTTLLLENLWREKQANDTQDIKKLILLWEKIVAQKPDYRDAYLQLAILNYKIFEDKKAQDFLKKALMVDPNFGPALELKKIIPLF